MELVDDHYCFACGTDNPISLKLTFTKEDDRLSGTFTASREHQGYRGVVHGGIISTLIDEAMARLLIMKGHSVVTVKMEVRYRKPVPVGEELIITAQEEGEPGGKFLRTSALIMSQDGMILSRGEGTFAVIKKEVSS